MKHPTLRALAALLLIAPATAQWGSTAATNQPSGRSGALMGYDLVNNRMLMFGGGWSNEFWALQNGAWSQLQPNPMPPSRRRADMAVDSLTGNVLLYGGDGGSQFALDDTWLWDGTTWSQATPSTTPGGLARHSMAFDLVRQTTVLFGGRYDSWVPAVQSMVTWEFASGNWSFATPAAAPPARVDAAMSYHSALAQVMLFGGEDGQGVAFDDTWIFDGTTWTQINATGIRPSARSGARLVPVLSRSLCALFGGVDSSTNQPPLVFNDTWEHDGTDWRLVPTARTGVYPARYAFAMAHDLARDRIVAFGGKTANNALRDDTWEYGAHWLPFGNGCAGTLGIPTLTGGALPRLGMSCDAQLGNLPPGSALALMAIGLSRTQWAFGPLPSPLASFGMPGCTAFTSADAIVAVPVSAGVGNWSWNVPSSQVFFGYEFHLQGIALDANANAGGAIVTKPMTMVLGW